MSLSPEDSRKAWHVLLRLFFSDHRAPVWARLWSRFNADRTWKMYSKQDLLNNQLLLDLLVQAKLVTDKGNLTHAGLARLEPCFSKRHHRDMIREKQPADPAQMFDGNGLSEAWLCQKESALYDALSRTLSNSDLRTTPRTTHVFRVSRLPYCESVRRRVQRDPPTLRFGVRPDWSWRVERRGLAIVSGCFILDAELIAPDVYRVFYAKQGRGFSIMCVQGTVVKGRDNGWVLKKQKVPKIKAPQETCA